MLFLILESFCGKKEWPNTTKLQFKPKLLLIEIDIHIFMCFIFYFLEKTEVYPEVIPDESVITTN
jgi:hypothetical protein